MRFMNLIKKSNGFIAIIAIVLFRLGIFIIRKCFFVLCLLHEIIIEIGRAIINREWKSLSTKRFFVSNNSCKYFNDDYRIKYKYDKNKK